MDEITPTHAFKNNAQLLQEARAELERRQAAIDELVHFIDNYIEPDCGCLLCRDAENLIHKHTQRKEAA